MSHAPLACPSCQVPFEPNGQLAGVHEGAKDAFDPCPAELCCLRGVNLLGTEAVAALITFGFGELGLNRIHATHLVRNPASGKVMRKVGMSYEGCHRQHIIKHGRFEDQERFAILSTDPR